MEESQRGLDDWELRGDPGEPGPRRLREDFVKLCPEECPDPRQQCGGQRARLRRAV